MVVLDFKLEEEYEKRGWEWEGKMRYLFHPNTPSYSNTHECEVGYTKHVHEGVLEMEKSRRGAGRKGIFFLGIKDSFPFLFSCIHLFFSFLFFFIIIIFDLNHV